MHFFEYNTTSIFDYASIICARASKLLPQDNYYGIDAEGLNDIKDRLIMIQKRCNAFSIYIDEKIVECARIDAYAEQQEQNVIRKTEKVTDSRSLWERIRNVKKGKEDN